ncbi:hypothetical protein HYV12_04190 [Candidatus Dojkabacteria bacterium]|nr:hypothetical protein [Candidatus Dojkabacteria bacterium]
MDMLQKNINELREFRKRFGGDLNDNHIEEIFGVKRGRNAVTKGEGNTVWERKLAFARLFSKRLLFLNWVKYIAVTGSVAAEVAKEEDDIDIYVVVKNNRMWLYRGLMMINPNIFRMTRRVNIEDDKDRICLNLITEERGLEFTADIFNFHELYFMKSIYMPEYKSQILSQNKWVREYEGILPEKSESEVFTKESLAFKIVDFFAFYSQYVFMLITKHYPEYERLRRNNRRGRIEFFKTEFKERILAS